MRNDQKFKAPPDRYQSGWLDRLDARTGFAADMQFRYSALTDDLGGVNRLSYAQRSLCERALWLEYWLADQERTLATGGEFDVGKWVQAANSLQGILNKLGLQKVPHDVEDLAEYLAKQ